MLKYSLRRLFGTIPVIAIVALLIFSILYFAPGDPAAIMAGDNASVEDIERVRGKLGLDKGFVERFTVWAGNTLSGDLGTSIYSKKPVTSLILNRLLPTVTLVTMTMLLTVIIAVPLGAIAAAHHGTTIDRLAMFISVIGFSVPSFVAAYVLAYQFGLKLRWFPVQGFIPPSSGFFNYIGSMVLPSVSLSLLFIALTSRITRSSMLDVLGQDYIRTARSKGLSERKVVFVHALKNTAIPVITVVGLGFASLLGGAVIIESVFAIPGLGQLTVSSILARDYPVIQAILLMSSIAYVIVNLFVDLLYAVFDPRIRY